MGDKARPMSRSVRARLGQGPAAAEEEDIRMALLVLFRCNILGNMQRRYLPVLETAHSGHAQHCFAACGRIKGSRASSGIVENRRSESLQSFLIRSFENDNNAWVGGRVRTGAGGDSRLKCLPERDGAEASRWRGTRLEGVLLEDMVDDAAGLW